MRISKIAMELKKHPNFTDEPFENSVEFTDPTSMKSYLLSLANGSKSDRFPIGWDSSDFNDELCDTPEWFRELFLKANKMVFEQDESEKIRGLITPKHRRHKINILYMTALAEGLEINHAFLKNLERNPCVFSLKDKAFVEKSVLLLKKEGYFVDLRLDQDSSLYYLKIEDRSVGASL